MPVNPPLSAVERNALRVFARFQVNSGQMLCFYGPDLEKHKSALQQLIQKDLLLKEDFEGAYSLTSAGFAAMKESA